MRVGTPWVFAGTVDPLASSNARTPASFYSKLVGMLCFTFPRAPHDVKQTSALYVQDQIIPKGNWCAQPWFCFEISILTLDHPQGAEPRLGPSPLYIKRTIPFPSRFSTGARRASKHRCPTKTGFFSSIWMQRMLVPEIHCGDLARIRP